LDVPSWHVKVGERIKSLFRRQPPPLPTAEELAARAEAESLQEQFQREKTVRQSEIESRQGPFPF
jgi:hypothetical protein